MNHFIKIILLCLSSTLLLSTKAEQMKNMDSNWEKVQELENNGMTQDALAIVEKIILKSRKENNLPQVVKANLFRYKYKMILEEESEWKIVNELRQEISQTNGAEQALLHSILAELLHQYYNNNSWKFNQRTKTEEKQSEDFRTWDLQTLFETISYHYNASLQHAESTQSVALEKIDDILEKEKNSKRYRPTLYDFLAHRAIDYFSESNTDITQPANAFAIDNKAYFGSVTEFIAIPLTTEDTLSNSFQAIKIFQNLLQFCTKNNNKEQLADTDIKRLQYIREHYFSKEDAAFLYYTALTQAKETYTKTAYGDNVYFQLAQYIYANYTNADLLNKVSDKEKLSPKYVLQLCNETVKYFPQSEGAKNAKALIDNVLQKSISLTTEKAIIPKQVNKAFVQYQNIEKLFLKWVRIDYKDKDKIFELKDKETYEDVIKRINAQPVVKSWTEKLTSSSDYKPHKTEIMLPEVAKGFYILVAATNANFSIKEDKNAVVAATVFASDISFFTKEGQDTFQIYVVNRKTGAPLKEAKVTLYQREYDYNRRKYNYNKLYTLITDNNGYAEKHILDGNQNYNSKYFQVDITYKEDFLAGEQNHYSYQSYYNNSSNQKVIQLFTDRAIYRPSQTIYFKGIATQYNNEENNILRNEKVTVIFKDANYQEIAKQEFITNEFGSFAGFFQAPSTGLLGSMTLETYYGNKSIRVEEYKRPKFEVLFDEIKVAYNLNDTVAITGKALSYSGATLDGAQVKYTVTRMAHIPVWCWWYWRYPQPNQSSEKVISVGTTKTDLDGKYTISFIAQPDLSIDKTLKPYFTYKIKAEVTDINGETQLNERTVNIGYLSINADVYVPTEVDYTKETIIAVHTNNLNQQHEPTDVTLKLYKLKEPYHPKRTSLWEQPDTYTINNIEHEKLFPYDSYKDDDIPQNWEREALINTYSFNTKNQQEIKLTANQLTNGVYLIEFSCKDKNNNPIQFTKVFNANAFNSNKLSPKKFLSLSVEQPTVTPDQTLRYKVSSSIANAFVVVEVKYQNQWIDKQRIYLDKNSQIFSLPIKESYRGGIEIRCYTILENRFHSEYIFVNVPYPSTELKTEWITFRDKLQPGQKETWKLKISGTQKDKVAAELVATLYDASLDAFVKHNFEFYLRGKTYSNNLYPFSAQDGFGIEQASLYTSKNWYTNNGFYYQNYDRLNLFGLYLGSGYYQRYGKVAYSMAPNTAVYKKSKKETLEAGAMVEDAVLEVASEAEETPAPTTPNQLKENSTDGTAVPINPRKNLNETAFFFPQLQTDNEGNILLEFTMPEALTKWNFLGFAHTQDLNTAHIFGSTLTQKELMVVSNAPRFLREGDTLIFATKITNLSVKKLDGLSSLILRDALTGKEINQEFNLKTPTQKFSVANGQNTVVFWTIVVPKQITAITYEVTAKADNFTDGEQNTIPVLSNRMLVTESLPLWVSGKQTKKYTFKKLAENKSTTLEHHALTLEMSSNPAWYAIQALPYMMEYPYECAEQLFSRYYANTLAAHVAKANPRIKTVFNKWKELKSDALLSNLEKNQELKNVLLEESPWVREAQDETEQKKRIALLFDLNKLANEQEAALEKLEKLQSPNGGFMWFAGMPDNRFITQYILEGIGHLQQLKVIDISTNDRIANMVDKALSYLDNAMQEDFENIKKYDSDYSKNNHLDYFIVHYLYMRSFYLNKEISKNHDVAYSYFLNQAKQHWNKNNSLYTKAMLSLILNRNKEQTAAKTIIESFRQNAINSEELGMYWKANEQGGWYWYEAPIETQALLIEAFNEVSNDEKSVDAMKVWLIKQKQTTSWKSTKATAEACYALLLTGSNWIANNQLVEVCMNNKKIEPNKEQVEEGTGYYKIKWQGNEVKPELAKIELKKKDKGPAYGAIYWQYFEQIDKITQASTNLQLSKKYFIKSSTNKGELLKEITEKTPIKVGDLITVRIELKTDRNLEYVHLKDLRAAGTEPTTVLSGYKWQDGLGYYETTKDVATHFFIDWLSKGTYVFEYTLRASLAGNFSSGITQIECMYAPEFKAHSNGQRQTIVANE